MSKRYFLGIDGGGTKTEAVVIDDEFNVLGSGISCGSNTNFVSEHFASVSFGKSIVTALKQARLIPQDITAAGCTFGGVARAVFEELRLEAKPMMLCEGDVAFERAGIELKRGIALIAGTGSACMGYGDNGRRTVVGGWGAILGDDGSAFDIARRGIRYALGASEGRHPDTLLVRLAEEYFNVKTVRSISSRLRGSEVNQALIAGFAVKVTEAAIMGDRAAVKILETAGEELGELAAFVARKLFNEDDEFPFVLSGGVFKAKDYIIKQIRCVLLPQFPAARIIAAEMSPGEAVARLTRKAYEEKK